LTTIYAEENELCEFRPNLTSCLNVIESIQEYYKINGRNESQTDVCRIALYSLLLQKIPDMPFKPFPKSEEK
jgi:hypothetical protein